MWDTRSIYRILVGKTEGKGPRARPRLRWENNQHLKETGWEGMDWIDLAVGRGKWLALVNTVMNLRVP
jgi:hypothetical protein